MFVLHLIHEPSSDNSKHWSLKLNTRSQVFIGVLLEEDTLNKARFNSLTDPPTVGSDVYRKLEKFPEIPPSMKIRKNVKEP